MSKCKNVSNICESNRVIFVIGPTASGKTDVAVDLAKKMNGEIVSCDSMQIYKHFLIGTATPTKNELEGVPYHLVNFVDPKTRYDVSTYKKDALEAISNIQSRGKRAIVCGGTGLYVDALIRNISFESKNVDFERRAELALLAESKGNNKVHDLLRELDQESASKIHPNNLKRVIRAIEATETAGIPFSQQQVDAVTEKADFDYSLFFLDFKRDELYERINKRVDSMLERGLLEEVKRNRELGYLVGTNVSQAIGYKELVQFLDGQITYDESVELLKRESRRYAKRQLTWFKKYDERINVECCSDNTLQECTQNCTQDCAEDSSQVFVQSGVQDHKNGFCIYRGVNTISEEIISHIVEQQ